MTYMKLALWKMIVMELINFALDFYSAILSLMRGFTESRS